MKLSLVFLPLFLILLTASQGSSQNFFSRGYDAVRNTARRGVNFARGAAQGSSDMYRAYSDMREANHINSDKYFHARGNRDAARRGPGGPFAARVISNARELTDRLRGGTAAQSARDQEANRWGRSGGDLNRFRPNALPGRY